MAEAQVRASFVQQAEACEKLGSPFTALLCRLAAERLDRRGAVGRRILDWEGRPDAFGDAVALRLCGSLHALVRREDAPSLAGAYPPGVTPDPDALWSLVEDALVEHEASILKRLDLAPQTNEVGRSAAIMAGLLVLSSEFGLPFELYELGASAGLNLNLDRYDYDLGGLSAGEAGSAVRLSPRWMGPPPPQAQVTVAARRGVDLSPLSVENPGHRELLAAYIWPDQAERLARTLAAIEIGRGDPPRLDRGDAAEWVERTLTPDGPQGVLRVVFHTVAFQYFPPEGQARIRDHLVRIGALAGKSSPVAWLGLEHDAEFGHQASLRLRVWPDGTERVLGAGHPHVSSFRFL